MSPSPPTCSWRCCSRRGSPRRSCSWSTARARSSGGRWWSIRAACGRMHKRLSLEMGGKNAMIVMDDADLDLALEGVLWGAFGTTGQRCTATSRLIVHETVHDRFMKLLCDRADRLRLGPGLEETTEVGPLINEGARKRVEYYVGVGEVEGAQRLIGGTRPSDKRLERGWFYRPTGLAGGRP